MREGLSGHLGEQHSRQKAQRVRTSRGERGPGVLQAQQRARRDCWCFLGLNSREPAARPSSQQQRSLGKGLLPKPWRKGALTLHERCCPAPAPTRLLQNLPWSGWGQSGLDVGGELGIMAAAPQSPPGFKELAMTWFLVTCGACHRPSLPPLPTPQGTLPSLPPHPRPPGDSQAS